MQRMFEMVKELDATTDDAAYEKLFERIAKYESISDNMENEIGRYLGAVGDAHLSDDTKGKIRSMLRQIGELESIGDSCYNLARINHRKRDSHSQFTESQLEGVIRMYDLVDEALTQMNSLLSGRKGEHDFSRSMALEEQINACRNELKEKNIRDLDNHIYGYDASTVYMDLIAEFEKTGDYVINVVEARLGITHRDHPEQDIYPEMA
jgi:phosphate:Na+ symporter